MTTAQLVPSVSIANMVNQRAAVVSLLTQACDLITQAAELAAAGNLGMPRFMMANSFTNRGEVLLNTARLGADRAGARHQLGGSAAADVQAAILQGVDAAAWQYLMHQSGLRSLMDATAREAWDKSIADGKFPELTAANVEATFTQLHGARGDMFERGVIACFKSLAWDYKTNQPQKFGKRIVIRNIGGFYSKATDQLDDLNRVLHVLDGKPEPDHRGGTQAALTAAGLTYSQRAGVADMPYLSIRTFKNLNGHVTFKRLDLVDKLNLIIAKHYPGALPAPK